MGITFEQINQAKSIQDRAAHDLHRAVRLVAGPGSGKSFVIEERVAWLIMQQNISPNQIIAVSFTRAAANDLKERIYTKGSELGITDINRVRVSTLHSLALTILRKTGYLSRYPSDPVILDDWEQAKIFDLEFSKMISATPTRAGDIRKDHEAFWSTGRWNPPNAPVLNFPVTEPERDQFRRFYHTRTQAYSCVLPGEVIRTCVEGIQTGHIDPITELGVEYMIIDEVQDLNPCDFMFIESLLHGGTNVFISGDDDQSIYSFRYAFPQGIQDFVTNNRGATDHVLNECFRCTVSILTAAKNVLNQFPFHGRIPKNLVSLYQNSDPINNGIVLGKSFNSPQREMEFIGAACEALINNGVLAKDIMILLGNKRVLLKSVVDQLQNRNISYDANQRDSFRDSGVGRFLISLIRIKYESDDYIAHRVLIGTPRGIGSITTSSITDKVISNFLNYKDLFYAPLPQPVFSRREATAIQKAKENIILVNEWSLDDTIDLRRADIERLLAGNFNINEVNEWRTYSATLPSDLTLLEFKEYLETDSEATKERILNKVVERMQQSNPDIAAPNEINKIRVLSFHSSKGLSAKVAFIPGLEEDIFPTQKSQNAAGLILENARLFYVAMTRAKAVCILSNSLLRNIEGQNRRMYVSRFAQATGIVFTRPSAIELTNEEIESIQAALQDL